MIKRTHAQKQGRCEAMREGRKETEISVVARGRPLRGQTMLAPLQRGRLVASLKMMLCTDFLKL